MSVSSDVPQEGEGEGVRILEAHLGYLWYLVLLPGSLLWWLEIEWLTGLGIVGLGHAAGLSVGHVLLVRPWYLHGAAEEMVMKAKRSEVKHVFVLYSVVGDGSALSRLTIYFGTSSSSSSWNVFYPRPPLLH